MDARMVGEVGTLRPLREFPLKESETLSWETLFLETPPQHPSPQPSCGLPVFRDGELPQASLSAVGTLSVLPGFPEAAGECRGGPCGAYPALVGESLLPSFATLEAGWLHPLFSLAFVVPEAKEKELSLGPPLPPADSPAGP